MAIDEKTVKKIAKLARIEVSESDLLTLSSELSKIVLFMEELNEADISEVQPMTSVTPMDLKLRKDLITDGNCAQDILQNAPMQNEGFFTVPKVVE